MVKKKISITIDENVLNDFKSFCQENGMKVSSKIELLIKNSIKDSSLNKFI